MNPNKPNQSILVSRRIFHPTLLSILIMVTWSYNCFRSIIIILFITIFLHQLLTDGFSVESEWKQ